MVDPDPCSEAWLDGSTQHSPPGSPAVAASPHHRKVRCWTEEPGTGLLPSPRLPSKPARDQEVISRRAFSPLLYQQTQKQEPPPPRPGRAGTRASGNTVEATSGAKVGYGGSLEKALVFQGAEGVNSVATLASVLPRQ